MLMPVIIIGGMKGGVFTPTEAAVVAAFYALVISLFVHREMKMGADVGPVLVRAAKTTAIVMFLCAGAPGGQLHDHAGRPAGPAAGSGWALMVQARAC
jgi:TRAP-type C4-dicarboxylate transport system permease large subunit